jgi:Tol biopolymer transport system component/DNA-binding winged helix-turn-helix (wHTH) protein
MSLIRFGEFSADPATGELRRDGRRVRLPPQSFQVLLRLTRTPGELVTREALQAELWPATSQVEYEQGLNAAINRLREALGDSAAEPRYIETLPRRGYRFIGTLVPDDAPVSAAPHATPPAAPELTTGEGQAPGRWSRRAVFGSALLAGVVVLAIASGIFWRRSAPPPASGRLVPYTALGGEERAPAFSPDGTRIAFAWNGDSASEGFDLYVKSHDSERLLRITNLPARWLHGAWSPDAKSIAFTRRVDGTKAGGANGNGVFVVPAMGGAERRLAGATFANQSFTQLSWSSDSRRLAYATFNETGSHVIRIVNVETLVNEPLKQAPDCWHAGMPAFSADGRLAFVCTTSVGVYGVFVASFDGAPTARITTVMGEPQGLAWDSDQQALIVANDSGDGGGLWRLTPDGTMTRLPFGEEGSAPTLHGDDVAYVRARQAVDIWRMDLASKDPAATARRLIFSTRSEMTPQFSPDGSRIVFQSNRSGSAEIWMSDAEGANPVQLTAFGGPLSGAPQWCSDGRRVAFDSRAAGTSAIYIVDIDERQPRRVGSDNAQNSLPAWSADCRSILASDGRRNLYKLPADGGLAETFTSQQSYLVQTRGDVAIFNVTQPTGVALWGKPVSGGDEGPLPGMPLLDYAEAWSIAPDGIYFTTTTRGAAAVEFYDFAARSTRRIASLPRTPMPGGGLGLAVSHDGRWLLYTQAGEAQSDIMLMDNP